MNDIFISYSHNEIVFVQLLATTLESRGFKVWYDSQITPAKRWDREILDNLRQCQVVVAIISKSSLESPWAQLETGLGFALDKTMVGVNMQPDVIRPERDLPDYLKAIQIMEYRDASSTEKLMELIAKMDLPGRFGYELLDRGIDIFVPLEVFNKDKDEHVGPIEGVNLHSISAALELQATLLRDYNGCIQSEPPWKIRFLSDGLKDLDNNRNQIIIGGPGGVPYVHTLLSNWTNTKTELIHGYRFIVANTRGFESGPFLSKSTDKTEGIQDVADGKVVDFFERKEPGYATGGTNHAVIYTKGFNRPTRETNRVVIMAAFNRHVLSDAIRFLSNRDTCSSWLNRLTTCGSIAETLLSFSVWHGGHSELLREPQPRALVD